MYVTMIYILYIDRTNICNMYSIVVFPKENSAVEGVPSSWTTTHLEKLYCMWPDVKLDKLSVLIRKCSKPSDSFTWKLVRCILKDTAETYEEMRSKAKQVEAETPTDINSTTSATSTY